MRVIKYNNSYKKYLSSLFIEHSTPGRRRRPTLTCHLWPIKNTEWGSVEDSK